MENPAIETLARALAGLDADACVKIVEEIGRAMGPERLLAEVFLPALSSLGDIYARGLLDDLAFAQAAVITEQLWGLVAPGGSAQQPSEGSPAVVVGVPAPDRHDIGKNQVARLLRRAAVRVTDLGTGVTPERFATAAKEASTRAVVLSVSTQEALAAVPEVRAALEASNAGAKLIVGGLAAVTAPQVEGADAVALDAQGAVEEVLRAAAGAAGTAGTVGTAGGGTR